MASFIKTADFTVLILTGTFKYFVFKSFLYMFCMLIITKKNLIEGVVNFKKLIYYFFMLYFSYPLVFTIGPWKYRLIVYGWGDD